jgi:Eco57I restriction-modification methylase
MDQELRNRLRNVVTQCRKLLEDSISQELEGKYAVFAKKDQVTADPNAPMTHLSDEEQSARKDILDNFNHIKARGFKPKDALDQLIREIAFTHLNRFCAYKMMEAREVYIGEYKFRDAVGKGVNSKGVMFYLADHPEDERLFNTGHQDVAYRHFLDWLGGLLSEEIGVLFNPNDPANRLYPRQTVLDDVLHLLNTGDIKSDEAELRDAWSGIWSQDETIGWVYQYFTPKELRDQARKESTAPRNSYELAFRNQFFTPRYVVEFLTDNTLGRVWYEMRKGETKLINQCKFVVRHPTEIFMDEGEEQPNDVCKQKDGPSQEEIRNRPALIPHRPKKDPRDLKILDPACGSGHFLLYCFDLLVTIYEEAYADRDLGPALQADYPSLEQLHRDLPRLVLAQNLHGIDIDLRASQIAALALWLRCQRAYREIGLKKDRPKISRSNLVCAEPMPGEEQMLREFVGQLEPKVLGQMVAVVFEKMKLAGEAGSLLKIEEEIQEAVAAAKEQWKRETTLASDREGQPLLFTQAMMDRIAQKPGQESLFDLTDISDAQFFERAELEVVAALRSYAERAEEQQRLQKRLFTEDAVRGFAFVDLSQKRYDVVLMNPPFGAFSKGCKQFAQDSYSDSSNDLLCAFTQRYLEKTDGYLGAITSRTPFFIGSGAQWRQAVLLSRSSMVTMADLGSAVMDDAMVESAAYVLSSGTVKSAVPFFRMLGLGDRRSSLLNEIVANSTGEPLERTFHRTLSFFTTIPDAPFAYWTTSELTSALRQFDSFEPTVAEIRVGLTTLDNPRFVRALWEVPPHQLGVNGDFTDASIKWAPLVIGGKSQPWFSPIQVCVLWGENGKELREHIRTRGSESRWIRSPEFYFRPGFSWTRRAVRFIPYAISKGCIPTASRYMAYPKAGFEVSAIGVSASNISTVFLRFYGEMFERPNYLVDNVKALPWPTLSSSVEDRLKRIVESEVQRRRSAYRNHEPFQDFVMPSAIKAYATGVDCDLSSFLGNELELEVAAAFGLSSDGYRAAIVDLNEALVANNHVVPDSSNGDSEDDEEQEDELDDVLVETERSRYEALLSYCVGVAFGRWDVRMALDTSLVPKMSNTFDSLPVCPPGTLLGPNGLPARRGCIASREWLLARPDMVRFPSGGVAGESVCDDEYPVRISWDGILSVDPDHHDDVVRRARETIEAIWASQPEAIERQALEALGVEALDAYFRRPTKGGFFDDHICRYSKGRRKAPIYWLLQSSKKNYGLWLYYHKLDKDLLFKALVNYVEPKIRLEEDRLDTLRDRKAAAGESGKDAKRVAKEVERQEDFLTELRDFADKLRRAAEIRLEPNLNDGVVLNISPLHELVPWKEAKKSWDDLMAGRYEWSSIGKQLRQKGLVK